MANVDAVGARLRRTVRWIAFSWVPRAAGGSRLSRSPSSPRLEVSAPPCETAKSASLPATSCSAPRPARKVLVERFRRLAVNLVPRPDRRVGVRLLFRDRRRQRDRVLFRPRVRFGQDLHVRGEQLEERVVPRFVDRLLSLVRPHRLLRELRDLGEPDYDGGQLLLRLRHSEHREEGMRIP